MNFQDAPAPKKRRSRQERLEAQLEDVLERETVSIFTHSLPESERDIQIAQDIRQEAKRTRRVPVSIHHEPHEASEHLIRLEGVVAKPVEEVREPFHRSMHRWQTPMLDGVDVNAVLVRTSDLWIDAVDPDYFSCQFTPGDPDEALRESRRGLWTRLRKPFIRWTPAPPPVSKKVFENIEIVTPDTKPFNEAHISFLGSDECNQCEPLEQPDSVDIALLESEQLAQPENKKTASLFARWRQSLGERWAGAREREQELVEDVEEAWKAPYVQASIRPGRVVIAFFGLLCLVAMPAGAVSWSRSFTRSLEETRSVASELRPRSLSSIADFASWSDRMADLESITKNLEQTHGMAFSLAQLVPSTRAAAKTAQALLTAAQEGAEAARLVSLGVARLSDGDVATPDERLVRFQKYLREAQPYIDRLFLAAHQIRPETLPEALRGQVTEVQTMLFTLEPMLASAEKLASLLLAMVGHEQSRTYLVLFQNTGELRPSGGFMGSYAEVTLDRGVIRKLHVPGGGPYDLRSQLRARWRPPEPLRLVGQRWEFQDANWSPDFQETAMTVGRFWSAAGQPTVDGIIAVNSTILPKLLKLTGPIEMPAYNKRVTAENVIFETQKAVELEYDRTVNTPKAFVGDLNKEVMARLQSLGPERWPEVASLLAASLEAKEIQLWFSRAAEQEAARSFGWTGEWRATEVFASLGVVGANIAGQKSDTVIQEEVHQLVSINEQGAVEERVLLAREHRGVAGQIFQGANNVQYLRLYTSPGTVFTDAEGFEVPSSTLFEVPTEKETVFPGSPTTTRALTSSGEQMDLSQERGRSVAGGWIQLRPGMSRETAFSYKLARSTEDMAHALLDGTGDQSVTDAYVLELYSQSGAPRRHHLQITYPATWQIVRLGPGMTRTKPGVIEWEQPSLTRDQTLFALFSRYASSNP